MTFSNSSDPSTRLCPSAGLGCRQEPVLALPSRMEQDQGKSTWQQHQELSPSTCRMPFIQGSCFTHGDSLQIFVGQIFKASFEHLSLNHPIPKQSAPALAEFLLTVARFRHTNELKVS